MFIYQWTLKLLRNVGQRHGEVVILPIDIEGLENIGHKFYLSENKVWLCDDIPSRYIYGIKSLNKKEFNYGKNL